MRKALGSWPAAGLAALALLYLWWLMFPGRYGPIGMNLDESWVYEINRLSAEFGWRGAVFSHGPLGFLLHPRDVGVNLPLATGFWLLVHALFGALLVHYARQSRSVLTVLLCVAGYTIAGALGLQWLGYEHHLMIVFGLLLALRPDLRRWRTAVALASGALGGLLLFVKLNLGFCALTMLIVSYLAGPGSTASAPHRGGWLHRVKRRWAAAAQEREAATVWIAGLAYALTVAALGWSFLAPLGNLLDWFRFSLDILLEYSVALSVSGPVELTTVALLGLSLYGLNAVWLTRHAPGLRAPVWVLATVLLFAFKACFVRQDGHEVTFFPILIAAFSVLILQAREDRGLRVLCPSLVVAIALALPAAAYYRDLSRLKYPDVLTYLEGRRSWEHIHKLLRFGALRRELSEQTEMILGRLQMPQRWRPRLRHRSVGTIPFRSSICAANRLRCVPNPVLQWYAGASQAIDLWSAAHYRSPAAPDYLIVEFHDIDGRHPLWGLPATWQAVLRRYRVVETLREHNTLLLKKSGRPVLETAPVVDQVTVPLRQWIEVPRSGPPLLAALRLRLGAWGALRKLLFRIPPVLLELETRSGARRRYRMLPATAAGGLLINFLPPDIAAFSELLRGRFSADQQVVRFRISGSGSAYYDRRVELRWLELEIATPAAARRTAAAAAAR